MPLGRFGRADEVADAVIFLLSDASSLFTGQTLNPNGGRVHAVTGSSRVRDAVGLVRDGDDGAHRRLRRGPRASRSGSSTSSRRSSRPRAARAT